MAKSSLWVRDREAFERVQRAHGASESLLLHPLTHEVLEGLTSNVFLVRDGVLCTAPTASGLLGGVLRAFVLAEAARRGVRTVEERLWLPALLAADEVFLVNAVRGVVVVEALCVPPGVGTVATGGAAVAVAAAATERRWSRSPVSETVREWLAPHFRGGEFALRSAAL